MGRMGRQDSGSFGWRRNLLGFGGEAESKYGVAGGAEVAGDAEAGLRPAFGSRRAEGEDESFPFGRSDVHLGWQFGLPFIGSARLQPAMDLCGAEVVGEDRNRFWLG